MWSGNTAPEVLPWAGWTRLVHEWGNISSGFTLENLLARWPLFAFQMRTSCGGHQLLWALCDARTCAAKKRWHRRGGCRGHLVCHRKLGGIRLGDTAPPLLGGCRQCWHSVHEADWPLPEATQGLGKNNFITKVENNKYISLIYCRLDLFPIYLKTVIWIILRLITELIWMYCEQIKLLVSLIFTIIWCDMIIPLTT